jgi:uncharacterized protein
MYYHAILQCTQALRNLEPWLDRAEQHAAAKKFDVGVLMIGRLEPDMKPFVYQVQSACDYAKAAAAWLSGQTPPRHEDNEQTMDELRARIQKTVAFAESVQEAQYIGAADRKVSLSFAPARRSAWRRGLPAADDDPERLFPYRDGLHDPPPQRRRYRQDGLPWSDQLDRRLNCLKFLLRLSPGFAEQSYPLGTRS